MLQLTQRNHQLVYFISNFVPFFLYLRLFICYFFLFVKEMGITRLVYVLRLIISLKKFLLTLFINVNNKHVFEYCKRVISDLIHVHSYLNMRYYVVLSLDNVNAAIRCKIYFDRASSLRIVLVIIHFVSIIETASRNQAAQSYVFYLPNLYTSYIDL